MPAPDTRIARVVAIGASNLTRGFQTVVSTARTAWGPDVEVVAALGHGRSYGATSAFLVRRLPGILECGLWQRLDDAPPVPTRALVTDVGNDILYGVPAARILAWVDEAVTRLATVTDDIALTGLPMDSIRRLSPRLFLAARTVLAPDQNSSRARCVRPRLPPSPTTRARTAAASTRTRSLVRSPTSTSSSADALT
jgi:hypothetical protein